MLFVSRVDFFKSVYDITVEPVEKLLWITWCKLVCDDCKLIQVLCFWTYSLSCFLFKMHNVLETGFCLWLQAKPTQLGPVDRASPYLRTPASTRDRIYKTAIKNIKQNSARMGLSTRVHALSYGYCCWTSRQTTHITWKGESFIVWSVEPRLYFRIRRISTRKIRT
jgi:hypothetical protein